MSTPRGNQGKGREERRIAASPYSRNVTSNNEQQQQTPSRLSNIMSSLLSPFRSSKTKQTNNLIIETEIEMIQDVEVNEDPIQPRDEDMATVYQRELDGTEGAELEGLAPPSPTPLHRKSQLLNESPLYLQDVETSSNNSIPSFQPIQKTTSPPSTFSFRTKDFNSRPQTPQSNNRISMDTSPTRVATEALAVFFREKANSGGAPLNAIESAGVFQLMQQAQLESLPSAFTPNFRSAGGDFTQQQQQQQQQQSNQLFSPSNTRPFSPASSSRSSIAGGSTSDSPYRRRRPLYVGAGYSGQSTSSKRRRQGTAIFGNTSTFGGELRKSQSDGMISDLLNNEENGESTTVAAGKRRKIDDVEESGLSRSASLNSLPTPEPLVSNSAVKVSAALNPKAAVISTPARPSPLWQVSKADTPSPSPPKKSTLSNTPTRAADIMMDIIRQEDAARPKISREAVLNPYESSDNPIARIPRSRPARVVTPRKPTVSSPVVVQSIPTPVKQISPLELLERTMPPELRREESQRPRIAPAPPPNFSSSSRLPPKANIVTLKSATTSSTPKSKPSVPLKKNVEVIELLSSDDEEEEVEKDVIEIDDDDEEDDEDDDEEEDEEEDEDEIDEDEEVDEVDEDMNDAEGEDEEYEESEDESSLPSMKIAPPQKLSNKVVESNSISVHSKLSINKPFNEFKPPFSISSTPSVPPSAPVSFPSSSSFTSSTPVFSAAPFSFGIPTSLEPVNITKEEAKRQALEKSKILLPTFNFKDIFSVNVNGTKVESESSLTKAMKELAKDTTRSELPTIVFW